MNDLARVIGTAFGGLIGAVIVFCFVMVVIGWPLLALYCTFSLRKIARQLERIGNTLEAKSGIF